MTSLFPHSRSTLNWLVPDKPGYRVEWNEKAHGYDITVPQGQLFYSEDFFNKSWSDRTLEYLQECHDLDWRSIDWRSVPADQFEKIHFKNIKWTQDYIKIYGKRLPLPRLTSWYGDPGAAYSYSGIKSEPNGWNEGLNFLRRKIEAAVGHRFNCVLLNWYRDGQDSLSWHADDEPELGINPTIASANFGETRDFAIRRRDDPTTRITIPLMHGTLLVMGGELQSHWQHSVPKRAKTKKSRFNLTFRYIETDL